MRFSSQLRTLNAENFEVNSFAYVCNTFSLFCTTLHYSGQYTELIVKFTYVLH